LDEHKFEASIISTTDKKRDWGPDAQVLMFTLVPKGQFSLHQLVVAELIFFFGTTVPPAQDMVYGRPIKNVGCVFVIWVNRIYTQFGRKKFFENR
jgi:hypothetical protein